MRCKVVEWRLISRSISSGKILVLWCVNIAALSGSARSRAGYGIPVDVFGLSSGKGSIYVQPIV